MNNNQFIKARLKQMKKDVINLQNQIEYLQSYLDTLPSSDSTKKTNSLDEFASFLLAHAPSD